MTAWQMYRQTIFKFQSKISKYRDTITKALEYIIKNLEGVDDNYSLAVASYVTQLAKDQSRTVLFQKLDANAKTNGKILFIFDAVVVVFHADDSNRHLHSFKILFYR